MEHIKHEIKKLKKMGIKSSQEIPINLYIELLRKYYLNKGRFKKESEVMVLEIEKAIKESKKEGAEYFENCLRKITRDFSKTLDLNFRKFRERK